MNLFGDTRAPRKNLWAGLVLAAMGAYWVGQAIGGLERPEPWPGSHRFDWIQVALGALFIAGGLMQFRLGLRGARFPTTDGAADPTKHQ